MPPVPEVEGQGTDLGDVRSLTQPGNTPPDGQPEAPPDNRGASSSHGHARPFVLVFRRKSHRIAVTYPGVAGEVSVLQAEEQVPESSSRRLHRRPLGFRVPRRPHAPLVGHTDFAPKSVGRAALVAFDAVASDDRRTVTANDANPYVLSWLQEAVGTAACWLAGTTEKGEQPLNVVKLDLEIWNGGSDMNNATAPGAQGAQVPSADKKTVGAYLLVNWDDDGTGKMNPDGTWATPPVPDLEKTDVPNEDNLAKLLPSINPLPSTGTVELELTGADADKIKLWKKCTKGTEIPLTGKKKSWDLSNAADKSEFQGYMSDGLWIEGVQTGTAERAVQFVLRLKGSDGKEVGNDQCNATVVMMNLGNAVYRDNDVYAALSIDRGHAALVYKFIGSCCLNDLNNDDKYLIIEMAVPASNKTLTTMTQDNGNFYNAECYGCFTNPTITYRQRLGVLSAAKTLASRHVGYTAANALKPKKWNGKLNTITDLRCDGLVEVCYEINGVDVWGKTTNGTTDYSIVNFLTEHNVFGTVIWDDTLQPATQCGHKRPRNAATTFRKQNLCIPVGDTGGN